MITKCQRRLDVVETLRIYCSVVVALCCSLVSLKVKANDTANGHAARASGEDHGCCW